MKRVWAAVLAGAVLSGGAAATPLRMKYCVTPSGALHEYRIELICDNNDGTWAPGQGFGWIIFGDTFMGPSPIADFQMDPSSYPIGPFTQLESTLGQSNGPTLGPIVLSLPGSPQNLWIPAAVGEKLLWEGTSAANIAAGQMKWTNLMSGGGATLSEFVPAVLVPCACYPDCNNSGGLSIADFGCFQAAFAGGLPYADCNSSGGLSIADFACFQASFASGCP